MVTVNPSVVNADLQIVGAFGIGVVSAEALAIGEAWSLPPLRILGCRIEPLRSSHTHRKIGANESLVMIAESQTGAFEISTPLRTLVMLS